MNKLVKRALATVIAAPLVLAAAPAAHADTSSIPDQIGGGTVSVEFPDFTFDSAAACKDEVGTLTLAANDELQFDDVYVNADLNFTQDGRWVDGWTGTLQYNGSYGMTTNLCPSTDKPGVYQVSGTLTFWDWDYNSYEVPVSDAFTVSAARPVSPPAPAKVGSRLSYAKVKDGRHGWKITSTLTRGGRAYAGQRIVLQRKYGSAWRNTTKSCYTQATGRCSVKFTQRSARDNRAQYRLAYTGNGATNSSASRTLRITKR